MQPFALVPFGGPPGTGLALVGQHAGGQAPGHLPNGNGRVPVPLNPALEQLVEMDAARHQAHASADYRDGGRAGRQHRHRGQGGPHRHAPPPARLREARDMHLGPLFRHLDGMPTPGDRGHGRLEQALWQARQWLEHFDAAERMAERGLRLRDVQEQIDRIEQDMRRALAGAQEPRGRGAPPVPTADTIFTAAVLNTEPRPSVRPPAAAPGPARPQPVDLQRRAQALAYLERFEARAALRLDHAESDGEEGLRSLAGGWVRFFDERDLIQVVPCACTVQDCPPHVFAGPPDAGPGAPGAALHKLPVYPAPAGQPALIAASHRRWPVMVVRGREQGAGSRQQVAISRDYRRIVATDIYTDDIVEAAKLRMWAGLLREARDRLEARASWRRWLGL